MTVLAKKVDRAKLAATILLTLPGVPFLYYGEEIGMTGMKPDEKTAHADAVDAAGENAGFSAATPWQAVNPGYEQANVSDRGRRPGSLLNHYRKLIALRNAHPRCVLVRWLRSRARTAD